MADRKDIENINLSEVLTQVKRDVTANLNCIQVGIIQAFDSQNQTATIKVALKQVVDIKNDGTRVLKERPILLEVPCFILYGGNSFITMPITAGDNCILLFNDREIDNWFNTGEVSTPTTRRVHDLSDALAIVGLRNLQNSIGDYLSNGIRIAFNSSNSKIDLTENAIEVLAGLFTHQGDVLINGNLDVTGDISAGNGATGSFDNVTVVNGIVVSGS